MVKPYPRGTIQLPEKVTNYRLSRARRIVENAFGIATSRFRLFRRAVTADVEVAVEATKAIVALHNYLMADRHFDTNNTYCPPDYVDLEHDGRVREGLWRQESDSSSLQDIGSMGSNNYSVDAKKVRDNFCDYFNSNTGSVPWQQAMVTSTSNTFDRN